MIELISFVLIILVALQSVELTVAYHFTTRGAWKSTEMGRHLMAFMAAIAAVLLLAATGTVTREVLGYEDPMWFQTLRITVFMSIPVVLGWKRYLLAKAQRKEK